MRRSPPRRQTGIRMPPTAPPAARCRRYRTARPQAGNGRRRPSRACWKGSRTRRHRNPRRRRGGRRGNPRRARGCCRMREKRKARRSTTRRHRRKSPRGRAFRFRRTRFSGTVRLPGGCCWKGMRKPAGRSSTSAARRGAFSAALATRGGSAWKRTTPGKTARLSPWNTPSRQWGPLVRGKAHRSFRFSLFTRPVPLAGRTVTPRRRGGGT